MDTKKVLVLLCVAWIGAEAFAYSLLGPPTAELEKTTVKNDEGEDVSHFENRHGYIFSYSKAAVEIDGVGRVEDLKVPLHKHDTKDEIFYCIKGSGFGVLEDREVGLTVGK